MFEIPISIPEKTFILHGVEEDLRNDGRSRMDYRPLMVETGILAQPNGSCRVRLANTDVLVATKLELEEPCEERSNEGKIEFFIDCSANATPEFEGRGGEELANQIARHMSRAYEYPMVFDLRKLCVAPGKYCWKMYVDVLILECGGNLYDAVSLAVKGAIFNTEYPNVKVTSVDGGEPELEIPDDPKDTLRLSAEPLPCLVTLCKIGDHFVVDPTPEEEACCQAGLVIGVTENGCIVATRKLWSGSIEPESFAEASKNAVTIGQSLNAAFIDKLKLEERKGRKKLGFLA